MSDQEDLPLDAYDYEDVEQQIPLKKGLDIRDVCNQQATEIEIDMERFLKESNKGSGVNMYTYDENNWDVINYDCIDDPDNFPNGPFASMAETMANVTPDGGVKKRIIRKGDGIALPDGATVQYHYNSYLEGNEEPFDSSLLRKKIESMCLKTLKDHIDGTLGVNLALKSMTKGEIAQFLIQPQYAYGKMGCPPRIPGEATIFYHIELLSFIDYYPALKYSSLTTEEQSTTTFETRIAAAKSEILLGCDHFKKGDFRKSSTCYKKAISILSSANLKGPEEEEQWKKYLIKAHLNFGLCCLRTEKYPLAITNASEVLRFESNHAKAFYIKGKAKYFLKDFEDSHIYLQKALKLMPKDSCIIKALNELKVKWDKSKKAEMQMCQRMFGFQSVKAAQISNEFKKKANNFVERFMNEDDKEVLFPYNITNNEMEWLSNKLNDLNLNYEIMNTSGKVTDIVSDKKIRLFKN